MNPRDEKILIIIHQKQNSDYGNAVPFSIIQKSLRWIDGTDLTSDLLKLNSDGYIWKIEDPVSGLGWWYGLSSAGNREYERIKYDNAERRKNRSTQIISAIIGAFLGFVLGRIV